MVGVRGAHGAAPGGRARGLQRACVLGGGDLDVDLGAACRSESCGFW
jgi:hypothetical protein